MGYIKTEEAVEELYRYGFVSRETIAKNIRAIPSIDIVRCQDCKHRTYCYGDVIWTNKRQTVDIHKTIDFCSYGEVSDE